MPDEPSGDPERLSRIQRRFAEFAAEYAALPLYSELCRNLAVDRELAALLLVARPGQARPVLWLAALHDLVLRRPDTPAAQWYPSVMGPEGLRHGDPWPDVRDTVRAHRDELLAQISTHGTQTNEVNRAVYVSVGLAAAASDCRDRPLALVELGASAGLLLAVDRYAVRLDSHDGEVVLGDPGSPVRCAGEDRAGVGRALGPAGLVLPQVRGRIGLDLEPIDLADDDAVRWLEACLWPEVPGRVERFRSARDLLRDQQPAVQRGDLVDDFLRVAAHARDEAGPGAHVVVFSSWALTYVDSPRRADLERAALARPGRSDLSWLTAEPPACARDPPTCGAVDPAAPSSALRRWRGGRELDPRHPGHVSPARRLGGRVAGAAPRVIHTPARLPGGRGMFRSPQISPSADGCPTDALPSAQRRCWGGNSVGA